MLVALVIAPVALLLALSFFGRARIHKFLTAFVCWILSLEAIWLTIAIYYFEHGPAVVLLSGIGAAYLGLFSFWIATSWSIATSEQISPAPVEVVADTYRKLDPSEKELLWKGVRATSKITSIFLRQRGKTALADSLDEVAKVI